jgi:hypothetical protein
MTFSDTFSKILLTMTGLRNIYAKKLAMQGTRLKKSG